MLGAACDASPLARPKSGIAPRLPHVLRSDAPLATDFRLPPRFTTYQSLLTTHAILIAGVGPVFSPAAAPRISNRYTQIIRKRPNPLTTNEKTFSNRYDLSHFHVCAALHPSLVTHHSSPPHLISIRYK